MRIRLILKVGMFPEIERSMMRFVIEPEPKSDVRELFEEISAAGFGTDGVPINFFGVIACRPDMVRFMWDFGRSVLVEQGALPGSLKQMMAMSISAKNNCRYCTVTHTGALEQMGVPTDVIISCVDDPSTAKIPAQQRAILVFAIKAARSANDVTDEDVQRLRECGISEGEILETIAFAAYMNFINTWADATGIEVDALPATDVWGRVVAKASVVAAQAH